MSNLTPVNINQITLNPSSITIEHTRSSVYDASNTINARVEKFFNTKSFENLSNSEAVIKASVSVENEMITGIYKYIGIFVNGKLEGEGEVRKLDGTLFQIGIFEAGKLVKGEHRKDNMTYIGNFKDGKVIKGILEDGGIGESLFFNNNINISTNSNSSLKLIVNVGLKNCANEVVKNLQKKYSGLVLQHYLEFSSEEALNSLLQLYFGGTFAKILTQEEKDGLHRVFCHRANYRDYVRKIYDIPINSSSPEYLLKVSSFRNQIKSDIQALSDPSSNRVIRLGLSSCFVIPGGSQVHLASYEFQKKKDGRYYFLIHNRGEGSTDLRLHGKTFYNDGVRSYSKTTVAIETTIEGLSDDNFLDSLIGAELEGRNMDQPYDAICKHFLVNKKGSIVETDEEKQLGSLITQLKNSSVNWETEILTQNIKAILKKSLDFKSHQLYGTCGETNSKTLEERWVSCRVLKMLRQQTLERLVKAAKDEVMPKYMQDDVRQAIIQVQLVIQRLKDKLGAKKLDLPRPILLLDNREIAEWHLKNMQRGGFVIHKSAKSDLEVSIRGIKSVIHLSCFSVDTRKKQGYYLADQPLKFFKSLRELQDYFDFNINNKDFLDKIELLADKSLRDTVRRNALLIAIYQDEKNFKYAGPEINGNKKIALKMVSVNGWNINYVAQKLRDDKDVLTAAIRWYGRVLEVALKYQVPEIKALTDIYENFKKQLK